MTGSRCHQDVPVGCQIFQDARCAVAAQVRRRSHGHELLETSKKFVLPLDHGPRAETTPWLNQQRMQRLAAKAAAEVRVVEKK